jgi:hypothetical protein
MPRHPRIYVPVTGDNKKKVQDIAQKEIKSMASIAQQIFEDGLKLYETPKPIKKS